MTRVGVLLVLIAATGIAAVAVVTTRASSSGQPLPLRQVASVQLPGPSNRFDYTSLDPTTAEALYRAHGRGPASRLRRPAQRKVLQDDRGARGPRRIAVPQLHRVYASATDERGLLTIDRRTGRVHHARAGRALSGWAGLRPGRGSRVRLRRVRRDRGGLRRGGAPDRDGSARRRCGATFSTTPVPRQSWSTCRPVNEVAVIDPRSNRVVRRVALAGCDHAHGLLVDGPRRLAFVACDGNARLLTLDLKEDEIHRRSRVGAAQTSSRSTRRSGASTSRQNRGRRRRCRARA